MSITVLYLAGSGRSGSTLATTVLGQLPGFFAAGELRFLWRRGLLDNRPCGCGTPLTQCVLWTRVLGELPVAAASTVDAALRDRLRMRRLPAMLNRHRRGEPAVPAHPGDEHLATLYAAIATQVFGESGGVIIDSSKLPPYGALVGALPGIDLYVLHVVRDPRAAVFSWRRRRGLDGERDTTLMARPPALKAGLLWLVWNAATLRLWGGTARYLRVRYEDFVAAPAETVTRIAGFVGAAPAELPFPTPHSVRLEPTHSVAGNPSRHHTGLVDIVPDTEWHRGLTSRAYVSVTALTLPLLRHFGYPLRRPAADGQEG